MRILQVITDNNRRGAQVFATHLMAALADRGHHVDTVALVPGSVGTLGFEYLATGWPSTEALRLLRRRMGKYDISVAHGSATGPACAISGAGRRPFVYRQISDSVFWAPTWAKQTRTRVALNQARAVVALSEFNRLQLIQRIGVKPGKIVIVPNGVPAWEFGLATSETRAAARATLGLADLPTVLFVGALVPEKGADLAIWSLKALPDAQLVIAGAGTELENLERLAAALAPGRVHFVGHTAEAAPLYHAADVMVLPSRGGDSMPAVLLEAGLCGLPVVSTRIGAIPEVIVDGRTGFVVPPDDLAALDRALTELLGDAPVREAMGVAARERCLANYEIGRVAEQWEAALEHALGRS